MSRPVVLVVWLLAIGLVVLLVVPMFMVPAERASPEAIDENRRLIFGQTVRVMNSQPDTVAAVRALIEEGYSANEAFCEVAIDQGYLLLKGKRIIGMIKSRDRDAYIVTDPWGKPYRFSFDGEGLHLLEDNERQSAGEAD